MPRFDKCLSEDTSSRNLRVLFLAGRRDCSRSFGETANRSLDPCRAKKPQPWIIVPFLLFYLAGSSSTRETLQISHAGGKAAAPQFPGLLQWLKVNRESEIRH